MVDVKELAKKFSSNVSRITESSMKASKTATRKGKGKAKLKRIVKSSKTTLTLPKREYPSILSDPNRYFKDELEEVKGSMYFQ